jgi:hypothetical protein
VTTPDVTCGWSVVDYFLFVHYTAFGDDYRVIKDRARVLNRASAGEAVSATISKSAATTFSVTIIESTGLPSQQGLLPSQQGLCAHTEQSISRGSGFVNNFQGNDSVFGDDYRVNRDCAHRQNQASAEEAVLVMIF